MISSFQERLGEDLRRAASERPAARRIAARRRRVAGALTVVVVAVVAQLSVQSGRQPAAADVEIVRDGAQVGLRLGSSDASPEEIVAAAREVGLRVAVDELPVGGSLVGRFLGWRETGGDPAALRLLDANGAAFGGFTVPAGTAAAVDLKFGRIARPGEPYAEFSDATAAGEPLACLQVLGLTPAEAGRLARARDLTVGWRGRLSGGVPEILDSAAVRRSPWKALVVTGVIATSATSVVFDIAAVGAVLPGAQAQTSGC